MARQTLAKSSKVWTRVRPQVQVWTESRRMTVETVNSIYFDTQSIKPSWSPHINDQRQ